MGDLNDFQRFREQHARMLDRLASDPDIDDRDREAIRRFLDRHTGDLAVSTLWQYGKNLRTAASRLETPLVDLDEDGFWHVRSRLTTDPSLNPNPNSEGTLAETTVHNYMVTIRRFLRFLEREWAENIELSNPDPPTVDPDDMLTQEDIAALRNAANSTRNIALIEFLADTGARLSMVGSLRVGDVVLDDDRPYYRPNDEAIGLKGAAITRYPIIDAKGALRSYLRHTHPRPDQDDVALFHRVVDARHRLEPGDDGAITPVTIRRMLRKTAEAAEIHKPVNPHNFRHSAVTRMAREGYDRTEIEHRVHWDLDTDMWERYLHLTSEQINDNIYEKAGVAEASDGPSPRREVCPNCNFKPLPPVGDYCPACAAPVTKAGRDAREDLEDKGFDDLASSDLTPWQRRLVKAAVQMGRGDSPAHIDPSSLSSSKADSSD